MNRQQKNLSQRIGHVINKLIFFEKRGVFHLGPRVLYPSEIHLMQVIWQWPDLNAGEMARKLGVSNGAVSQTLARLERKGVITKTKDPSLKNRVTAIFTDSGQEAIQRFTAERASALESFSSYLAAIPERDREIIESFLERMEEFLEELG